MDAVLDVFRVLWDPNAVFTRVGEKPRFWLPFLVLALVQIAIAVVMMPYSRVATEAAVVQAMQARGATGPAPNVGMFQWIGIIFQPLGLGLIILIATAVLWMSTSLFGGEGKFSRLISVATYSSTWFILQAIVGLIVIILKGKENIQTVEDLQPALGLDLLAPSTKGFVGYLLKGVTPFSLLMYWTVGTGVAVTHKLEMSTGRKIALAAFLVMLLVGAAIGATCAPKAVSH